MQQLQDLRASAASASGPPAKRAKLDEKADTEEKRDSEESKEEKRGEKEIKEIAERKEERGLWLGGGPYDSVESCENYNPLEVIEAISARRKERPLHFKSLQDGQEPEIGYWDDEEVIQVPHSAYVKFLLSDHQKKAAFDRLRAVRVRASDRHSASERRAMKRAAVTLKPELGAASAEQKPKVMLSPIRKKKEEERVDEEVAILQDKSLEQYQQLACERGMHEAAKKALAAEKRKLVTLTAEVTSLKANAGKTDKLNRSMRTLEQEKMALTTENIRLKDSVERMKPAAEELAQLKLAFAEQQIKLHVAQGQVDLLKSMNQQQQAKPQ